MWDDASVGSTTHPFVISYICSYCGKQQPCKERKLINGIVEFFCCARCKFLFCLKGEE